MFLPIIVSSQIGSDMKKETIKAQTVIARSNIRRILGEGKKYFRRYSQEKTDGRDYIRNIFSKKTKSISRQQKKRGGQGVDVSGELKLLRGIRSAGEKHAAEKRLFGMRHIHI